MSIIAKILIGLVAVAHVGFMILEMFFWDRIAPKPAPPDLVHVLAANQGLYNGFLAAGLVWAFWSDRRDLKFFFLGCVIIAGIYGAWTTGKLSILVMQAGLAALALIAVLAAEQQRP